ncbi:MAG: hypothetical protein R3191_00195 [Anaerolineales bacterium]|nr:hypothetical protein [Anaerolineales bacterium]
MNLELLWPSAVWSLIASLGPLVAPYGRRVIERRRPEWVARVVLLVPWLHGPGLAFAALFAGSLPARALGIFGSGGWVGWVAGALVVLVLFFSARAALSRWPIELEVDRYDVVVLDEPRWALYRGTGWLWAGSFAIGSLVGLGLALIEWSVTWRVWQPENRRLVPACYMLARIGVSALVFTLTGNLWLTMLLQVGLAVLANEEPR